MAAEDRRQLPEFEVTLSRDGAILVGLEVDPYPEKYVPITLKRPDAKRAAQAILEKMVLDVFSARPFGP